MALPSVSGVVRSLPNVVPSSSLTVINLRFASRELRALTSDDCARLVKRYPTPTPTYGLKLLSFLKRTTAFAVRGISVSVPAEIGCLRLCTFAFMKSQGFPWNGPFGSPATHGSRVLAV